MMESEQCITRLDRGNRFVVTETGYVTTWPLDVTYKSLKAHLESLHSKTFVVYWDKKHGVEQIRELALEVYRAVVESGGWIHLTEWSKPWEKKEDELKQWKEDKGKEIEEILLAVHNDKRR